MEETDPVQRARAAALRFLSYRPRSEAEVRARLRRRYSAPVVEQVVSSLVERELLDDTKFAELWRDSRASLNPRSATAIRRELTAKGVARDIADEAVRGMDDVDSAYRAGLKLARRLAQADLSTYRRRLWAYLRRRGFGESVVRSTIGRLWEERRTGGAQQSK